MPVKKKKNFVAQVMAGKERVYYLRWERKTGEPVWYFIQAEPPKEKALLKALEGSAAFHPEQFGKILSWGYGEPSVALKKEMQEKYKIRYQDE